MYSIYILFYTSVDCEWRDWQYGECTQTCGGGMRTNTRTKRVEESFGGVCVGESTAIEECNTQKCPGNNIYY